MFIDVLAELNKKWDEPYYGGVNLRFSNWVQWRERANLDNLDEMGVYILAKYSDRPPADVDPTDKTVIYIGKTTESLKRRLDAFDGAAFSTGTGHSGGSNYKNEYGDRGDDLYVSICPVYFTPPKKWALPSNDVPTVQQALVLRSSPCWKYVCAACTSYNGENYPNATRNRKYSAHPPTKAVFAGRNSTAACAHRAPGWALVTSRTPPFLEI